VYIVKIWEHCTKLKGGSIVHSQKEGALYKVKMREQCTKLKGGSIVQS
jgi:hypothetical protein